MMIKGFLESIQYLEKKMLMDSSTRKEKEGRQKKRVQRTRNHFEDQGKKGARHQVAIISPRKRQFHHL